MKLDDALHLAKDHALKKGAQSCDVLYSSSESEDLEVFEGELSKAETLSSQGLGIRLFKDQKPGYAFTQRLTKDSVIQMVDDAISHTDLTEPVKIDLPEPAELPDVDLKRWNPELQTLSLEVMRDFCLDMEQRARDGHAKVINVPHAGIGKGSSQMALVNSKGLEYKSRTNSISAYVSVVTQEGEQKKTGSYGNGGRSFLDFNLAHFSRVAVERGLELLGAKPIESETMPVVFSNRVSPSILGLYGSSFSADSVQKGQSRLVGKLGSQIAHESVQLSCEPHLEKRPGSRLLDSEGVVCQPLKLIHDGHLCSYIYNLESAAREGRASTGHGVRGLRGKAGHGFSNLIMERGSKSVQELMESVPRCLYVFKLEGSAACSAVSGEISIGVQGWLMENGQMVQPVDSITLNGNFFDLLKGIRGVSDSYSDTFSGVKIPDLLVEGLMISG